MLKALTLALLLPGAALAAPVCTTEAGTQNLTEMETAKARFLAGDYAEMALMLRGLTPGLDVGSLTDPIEKVLPDGFASCQTIVQRQDSGGYAQEVSLFALKDGSGAVALYVSSAPYNGGRTLLFFEFSDTLESALENLR